MSFLVKDKNFYRTFFGLASVIALQGLITFSVNLADHVMIGIYSESAMSGVSIVNQLQYLLQMMTNGVALGVVVLCAQYWGKSDLVAIRRIIALGMKFAAFLGLIFTAVTLFWPTQVLRLFTNDPKVIADGVAYLRYISYTYFIFTLVNTLILSFRSVETTVIGPLTALSSLVLNVFLNYVLIFGKLGMPELGVSGAAIATLISRSAELVIAVIYIRFFDKKLRLKFRHFLKADFEYVKDYIKVALPLIFSSSFWGFAMAAQTAILGHVGSSAIAASGIANTVFQIASIFYTSTSNASGVLLGKTIGRGNIQKVKPYARTIQLIFLLSGIIAGLIILIARSFIVDLYTLTEESYKLSKDFLLILAIAVVGTAYEFPAVNGIVQSGGDTRYALIVDTLFMCLFTLPFAALSAFVWRFPPLVTFIFLKADQILKCLPNGIKVNRYRWIKDITR